MHQPAAHLDRLDQPGGDDVLAGGRIGDVAQRLAQGLGGEDVAHALENLLQLVIMQRRRGADMAPHGVAAIWRCAGRRSCRRARWRARLRHDEKEHSRPDVLEQWRPRRAAARGGLPAARRRTARAKAAAGAAGGGGRRARGAAAAAVPAGRSPDLDELIGRLQAWLRGLAAARFGGRRRRRRGGGGTRRWRCSVAGIVGAVARQRLLPRAAGRAGRGAALRRLRPHRAARPQLSPALAGRERAAAARSPASTASRSATAPPPAGTRIETGATPRPRRAGRKPDADRRREHHRHRLRRVLAHPRRRATTCSTPATRPTR